MKIADAMNGCYKDGRTTTETIDQAVDGERKLRKLGVIKVSTCMEVTDVMNAFTQIKFLPVVSEFDVLSHTIKYTGYCPGFEGVALGTIIPTYTMHADRSDDIDGYGVYSYSIANDSKKCTCNRSTDDPAFEADFNCPIHGR
jgi:hypothetical protein